ncbi:LPXTG cell wall anchor domain-containing protein [Lactococcus petauri]|uniref:LPXTG cell wall anchor domain-containing protein n=1 Tax=Lactococcus petauri TaxID=1940789 RepID=UPI0013FE3083|nr:LPXTG cell wall anchor domain-containing protein [Lactococcus petauri]
MRYKLIALGLFLLIGTTTVNGHANSLSTNVHVGFYEAPSTVPSPPSETQNLNELPVNDSSYQMLPRTGETTSSISLIGGITIALGILLIHRRKNT